jgi:hypothetical protein
VEPRPTAQDTVARRHHVILVASRPRGTPLMAFVASLPMYDPPELRAAVDAWWEGLVDAFRHEGVTEVPDRLTRRYFTEEVWRHPALLITQVCGYDVVRGWSRRLAYLGTPCYSAPGCHGIDSTSFILVGADSQARSLADLRGAHCVINGYASHSGCNVLREAMAPLARGGRFFGAVTVSGSHFASLTRLATGNANVAAIDCVTYALMARCRPDLVRCTRILSETVRAPSPPYVTRADCSPDLIARLRGGLLRAAADPRLAAVRSDLMIAGIEILPSEAYERIASIEVVAAAAGYAELTPGWTALAWNAAVGGFLTLKVGLPALQGRR